MTLNRRELLERIQARLVDEFDSVTGRDAAMVAKQLAEVTRELETLPTGERSTVDDLAKRRAARRSEAAG